MGGIPGAGGADSASRAVIRVLLRCALLVGMVIAGWLLGSATALAQESHSPQDHPQQEHTQREQPPPNQAQAQRDHPWQDEASPGTGQTGSPDAAPAELITRVAAAGLRGDDLLAAVQAPRPVGQQPVLALEPALEPEHGLPPALHPVLNVVPLEPAAVMPALSQVPILSQVPLTAEVPFLVKITVADLAEPPPSAGRTEVTGGTIAAPPAPVTRSGTAAATAPTLSRTVAPDPAGGRLARVSGAAQAPVSPIPESPSRAAPTSCPATPGGSHTTTMSAHAVTLNEGRPETNRTLLHHRMCLQTHGVPGAPSRRPSTSPD